MSSMVHFSIRRILADTEVRTPNRANGLTVPRPASRDRRAQAKLSAIDGNGVARLLGIANELHIQSLSGRHLTNPCAFPGMPLGNGRSLTSMISEFGKRQIAVWLGTAREVLVGVWS